MSKLQITFPPGRLVDGSLYKANITDAEGKPLAVKSGPNAGQPRVDYYFAVAYPKNGTTHWSQTPWGQQIYTLGQQAFPQAHLSPAFAWKIIDGDSNIPNRAGRAPNSREGWAGNWIVRFSGGYAPKMYRMQPSGAYEQMVIEGEIKAGYFVEVAANIDSNGSQQQPGLYINHSMVCFSAYGQEILLGMSPEMAGFGKHGGALPPGASAQPLPGSAPMPQQAPLPPAAGAPTLPQQAPALTLLPPGVPVMPNHNFLNPGQAVIASTIPAPPAPPMPPLKRMAPGCPYTYEQLVAAGYNDQQMIAQGFLLP